MLFRSLIDELTSNYGPVSILWFDGVEPVSPDKWKNTPTEIAQNVYKKQPGIMLGTHGGMTEDFISFEVMVGPFDRVKPWETCEQINPGGWVYNKPMQPFPFKKLLTNLVYTVCRDGNYLLDVGPMADGRLYAPDVARLEDFAVWMNTNKEAIHGTRGGPYRDGEWGGATCREKCVYLFISDKIGEQFNIPLPDVKIINVQRLDGGNVSWNVANKELCLSFSGRNIGNRPDFICVKLDIDRPAFYLPLIDVQQNLALQASINVSGVRNKNDNLCGPQMLFDNKGETAWETEASDTTGYIEFDFGKPVPVGSLSIAEKGQTEGWNHRLYMALKVKSHLSDEWKLILEQNGVLGAPPVLVFNPVNTRFLKVEFKKTSTFPLQVAELRLFAPLGQ